MPALKISISTVSALYAMLLPELMLCRLLYVACYAMCDMLSMSWTPLHAVCGQRSDMTQQSLMMSGHHFVFSNVPQVVSVPLLIPLNLSGVAPKHSAMQLLCLVLHRQPNKVEQDHTRWNRVLHPTD